MSNATQNAAIASEITRQLGGTPKLDAMIGAYNFLVIDNGLQFRFELRGRFNGTQITLDRATDLYKIRLYRIGRNWSLRNELEIDQIEVSELLPTLERETGLAWRL